MENFQKYKDQLDKGQFLADFIKCLVSFGIREVSDSLFKAKVELIIRPEIASLDAKTTENFLFYLSRTGSQNADLFGSIMNQIEEKEWVVKGEFKDIFMLINILNTNRNFFQPKKLWDHIEAVACHQCFSQQSAKEMPPDVLNEIIGLYAIEFTKS